MYRWLRALVTLLTLVGLSLASHGYLVCRMTGEPMPSCCCGERAVAPEAPATPRSEVSSEPCCERRAAEATPTIAIAKVESAPAPAKMPAVAGQGFAVGRVALTRGVLRNGWLRERAPVSPRGPPLRRGKARARLGVMLC